MNLQKKMLQEAKITERNSNGENGDPEHLSDEDREALAKPETMIVSALLRICMRKKLFFSLKKFLEVISPQS